MYDQNLIAQMNLKPLLEKMRNAATHTNAVSETSSQL